MKMRKKILEKIMQQESVPASVKAAREKEKQNQNQNPRRNFLQKSLLGGLSLGAFTFASVEDTLAYSTQKVNRNSNPSDFYLCQCRRYFGIFYPKSKQKLQSI